MRLPTASPCKTLSDCAILCFCSQKIYTLKGKLLYNLNRLQESIVAYCTALKLDPQPQPKKAKKSETFSGLDRSLDKYVALNWKEIHKFLLRDPDKTGKHVLRKIKTLNKENMSVTLLAWTLDFINIKAFYFVAERLSQHINVSFYM